MASNPWAFFPLVALAVAMVESHLADQGYMPTRLEQATLRASNDVFGFCKRNCPKLLPTYDHLANWPCSWD